MTNILNIFEIDILSIAHAQSPSAEGQVESPEAEGQAESSEAEEQESSDEEDSLGVYRMFHEPVINLTSEELNEFKDDLTEMSEDPEYFDDQEQRQEHLNRLSEISTEIEKRNNEEIEKRNNE